MLTPKDIEEYPLEKAAFGGYKCEAVDAFLDRIAADYKQLTEENETLTKKITVLVEKIAEYRKDEDYIKDALVDAQRLVNKSLTDAEARAEQIISEANRVATEMVDTAEKRVADANAHFEMSRVEVNDFKSQLLTTYKSHIEIISALPNYEKPEPEQEEEVRELEIVPADAEDESADAEAEQETAVAEAAEAALPEEDPEEDDEKFNSINFG